MRPIVPWRLSGLTSELGSRNAAIWCTGPLEPALEPQMVRNSSSSLSRSHRLLEMAARACPGAAECSKWPLEPAPEPQNA